MKALAEHSAILKALLSSDLGQACATSAFNLKVTIGFLDGWSLSVEQYLQKSKTEFMKAWLTSIGETTNQVKSYLPEWKVIVTSQKMNDTMAKQKILNNPDKGKMSSTAQSLHKAVQDAAKTWTTLQMTPDFADDEECSGVCDLANKAVAEAYEAVAITAACNAVLKYEDKAQGPAMAHTALGVVDTMKGFSYPDSLKSRLDKLSQKVVLGSEVASKEPPTKKFKQEPKSNKAASTSSSSSASARVKKEKKT